MRRVRLAYGRTGMEVELPSQTEVLEARPPAALPDEAGAIRAALRQPLGSRPLRELVPPGSEVAISVCDVTRPFPGRRVLPVLLEELEAVRPAAVTVFIATGTHRVCTDDELRQMLGEEVQCRVQVVQHDAFDPSRHAEVGLVPGSEVPARVERGFLEHPVRITTGFIEPHFFAGFSGGPKMVAPGLAQLETVLELHSAARIGDPRATWGVTTGNPVHDPIRAIAARVGVTFNLDVALDREHRIVDVFAGELGQSHAAGCEFVRRTAMVGVPQPYDVVVTTNSGYPLDQNLYQTVKGMSAAAKVVCQGGTIVVASACEDGIPAHGGYGKLLLQAGGPEQFLAGLNGSPPRHDQWQAQIQAVVQRRARVLVRSDGLTPDQLREAWLEPIDDVSAAVAGLAGPGARVAALPQGPQTIPYLRS
ncbi:MAG: nickel-dependent lactate racemase [Candidatus Dormibacteraeota bacterium]|nr:nickel-dependent lactate racemase [Candidatus Dormibacteraeota bacterium]